MEKLDLPTFDFNIKKADGKILIFDIIRKKNVVLTPEEWVRQNLVRYLIEYREFPKSLIKVESGLRYNKMLKRSDILIYGRDGRPLMLVECKSPKSKITDNSLTQISTYNATLGAEYLLISNGITHFVYRVSFQSNEIEVLKDLPKYGDLTA